MVQPTGASHGEASGVTNSEIEITYGHSAKKKKDGHRSWFFSFVFLIWGLIKLDLQSLPFARSTAAYNLHYK